MGVLNSIKFYLKSVVFGSLIVGCALYSLIALIFLKIVGKEEYAQYTLAQSFYFTFSKVFGINITIKNEEYLYKKPAIVVSNHQSAVDLFVLAKIFKPGYTVTAKKALKYVPILGLFMLGSGTFFLDRSKGQKARATLEKALGSLKKEDRALFIFPEGTRSATKLLDVLPFKKGAFHLAKQAQIPVIPVAVSNYSNIFSAKERIFNRGEIIIEVLPPVSTENLKTNEDVTEFTANIRNQIKLGIERIGYAPVYGQSKQETSEEAARLIDEQETDATDTDAEVISEGTPLVSKD